jgi:hypothetical protein
MDTQKPDHPGMNRRGLLKCMAWAGTGLVWTVSGGVPRGIALGEAFAASAADGFTFVQISDSHIGFNKEANPDTNATLQAAIDRIGKLPKPPAMVLHTGDVTHLSKPEEFDTAAQILKSVKQDIHYVPGEHDVIGDDGKQFFERFAPKLKTGGWYSFDQGGVHFVGMVNVLTFETAKAGGFGAEQLEWLEKDLKGRTASTPVHARADVADLSAMGLGDRGCAASAVVSEAVRLGDRAERPYPPGRAEGRRQRHLSDRVFNRLPPAEGWRRSRAGADEGAARPATKRPRHPRDRHRAAEDRRRHGRDAGLTPIK